MSDMFFVTQSFGRLLRAFSEMAFARSIGVSTLAAQLMQWAKVVERRVNPAGSTLYHFCAMSDQKGADQVSKHTFCGCVYV